MSLRWKPRAQKRRPIQAGSLCVARSALPCFSGAMRRPVDLPASKADHDSRCSVLRSTDNLHFGLTDFGSKIPLN
jgi:hypothetical protein